MKQLFKSNKGLKVEEIPVPALTTGHILVRTLFSAISTGTETRLIKSDSNIKRILKSPKKALGKFRELSRYGITEAMNERKDLFGEDKLADLLKNQTSRRSSEIMELVWDELTAFRGKAAPSDDMTMVLVKVKY